MGIYMVLPERADWESTLRTKVKYIFVFQVVASGWPYVCYDQQS